MTEFLLQTEHRRTGRHCLLFVIHTWGITKYQIHQEVKAKTAENSRVVETNLEKV